MRKNLIRKNLMRENCLSLLRLFWRDRRGNIAVLSGLLLMMLSGFAALSVDVGKVFLDRRKAQSTVDLAALAAAGDLQRALPAARATVRQNDYPEDAPVTVELGLYTPDPSLPVEKRFKPAAAGAANAARVTLRSQSPLIFGRLITGRDSFDVQTEAIAARASFAGFAIGSRLASLDGGLANQVLGGLLGTGLNLSAMDYQALVNTRINLFDFLNALASRINVTAATYDALLASQVKVGDVVNAMVAVTPEGSASKTLSALSKLLAGSTKRLPLGALLDLGAPGVLPLGEKPKVGVSLAAFDMLSASAQLANGNSQIATGLNLAIPGISSANLKLAIGEQPQGTSRFAIGEEGTSVHTAQTRLLLDIQLVGRGDAALVRLPLYLEVASATARLTALNCNAPSITLAVTPGAADAWIAEVSSAQFSNFKAAPNPPAATILNAGVAQVTARGHVTVANTSATLVTFSAAEIAAQTRKTVGTKNFSASLLSGLIRDTELEAQLLGLGLGLGLLNPIKALVAEILAGAVAPVDSLLSGVLATLGIGLGEADVWVLSQRCDGAVLVN